ncbi:MAG: 30S ribosomal protein S20 [Phycisphaerales bacterium]|nr:30S ribosomal protein S20 [Phycisphaerales bacterium]
MAHSLSAKKRIRQNVTARARNRARKKIVKDAVRDFVQVAASGEKAKAAETLKSTVKKIDQVAAKGALHKNTAARRKSRLQKKLNALTAKA